MTGCNGERGMIAHQRTIPGAAFEASASQKMLIRRTAMSCNE